MKLAWKEISYNRNKYLMIELILVMMIFMVMFLSGLANGLARAVSAGIENVDAKWYVISDDAEKLITISSLKPSVLDEVKKSTDSKVTTLDIQRMNIYKNEGDSKLDVTYFAVKPESFANPEVIAGTRLTGAKNSIVLDQSFKDEGIRVGDTIKDSATGTGLIVVGFTKDQMYGHSPIGFISTETYTRLKKALDPGYSVKYHAILVQGGKQPELHIKGIELADKTTIVNSIPGYKAEQTTIRMILWVLVFVSAAILGVFFYIMTVQKHREFGVMKAIGIRMGEIAGTQLLQVLILACIGMVLGNSLAYGMASMLPSSMPFYLKFSDAFSISLAFVAMTVASSLFSIRRISKVDPVTIIGGN